MSDIKRVNKIPEDYFGHTDETVYFDKNGEPISRQSLQDWHKKMDEEFANGTLFKSEPPSGNRRLFSEIEANIPLCENFHTDPNPTVYLDPKNYDENPEDTIYFDQISRTEYFENLEEYEKQMQSFTDSAEKLNAVEESACGNAEILAKLDEAREKIVAAAEKATIDFEEKNKPFLKTIAKSAAFAKTAEIVGTAYFKVLSAVKANIADKLNDLCGKYKPNTFTGKFIAKVANTMIDYRVAELYSQVRPRDLQNEMDRLQRLGRAIDKAEKGTAKTER